MLRIALLLAVIPALAHAEGAARVFDCRITQSCKADGACRNASGTETFRLSPIEVDAGGGGRFQLSHGGGDVSAEATAPTGTGPFLWEDATGGVQALLLTDEDHLLWHRRAAGTPPRPEVLFLQCVVLQ